MSLVALELELQRLDRKTRRERRMWLGFVFLAASGVALLVFVGSESPDSAWMDALLVVPALAIGVSFFWRAAYFRDLRKRELVATDILNTLDHRDNWR